MFGCNSCGIELLPQRYSVSLQVLSSMVRALQGQHTSVGEVTFFQGSFVSSHNFGCHLFQEATANSPSNHPKNSLSIHPVKMFCNNFNASFSECSQLSPHDFTLDYHLGVLFALTPPGSKLVTRRTCRIRGLPSPPPQFAENLPSWLFRPKQNKPLNPGFKEPPIVLLSWFFNLAA
jgi:hypothetical protein